MQHCCNNWVIFVKIDNMKKSFFLFLMIILGFSSCLKDPVIPNEEELITTVNYILTPDGSGDIVNLSFKDIDGDGGEDPVITGGTLQANSTYIGTITLFNETESPSEDIGAEVLEEAEDHQLFYSSDIAGISFQYDDQDNNGFPLGLINTLMTGDAGSGFITVTLKHKPSKEAAGVSDGDITNAGGDTDIEVSFPVNVQ
jgi:hypothetical protein